MHPLKMLSVLFNVMFLFSVLSLQASTEEERDYCSHETPYRILFTDLNTQITHRLETLRFSETLLYPEIPTVTLWRPSSDASPLSFFPRNPEESGNNVSSSPFALLPRPSVVEIYDDFETPSFCRSTPIESILKSITQLALLWVTSSPFHPSYGLAQKI